ncbi:NUDIX domain-containing protein [Nocardioidaceae bacterium]|nr:NUDIX domain-containing protein [Nocardioidaceae bacterium]
MPVRHVTVSPGVARIAWDDLPSGFSPAVTALDAEIERALTDHHRVEVHIDPADAHAHRVVTWSGMRKEGLLRGVATTEQGPADRLVFARLIDDVPASEPEGFRALLNSFLPRKRAIAQTLIRDTENRVLVCQLTYKKDWDLPGGVVEVGESPQVAVGREVSEELSLTIEPGRLLLTDWLPAWSGWDDALCLVFDGGVHDVSVLDRVEEDGREIAGVAFLDAAEVAARCSPITAARVASALATARGEGVAYVEGGGS